MTLEEKAEESAEQNGYGLGCSIPQTECYVKGYVAGAKENGVVWHDLRKDPKDLPKGYGSVWTNEGSAYHDSDGWFDDYGAVKGVIAWCKPQFKED